MGEAALQRERITFEEAAHLDPDLTPGEPDEVPVTEEVRAELDRRLETFDEDLAGAVDWEDVRAEMTPSRA